MPVPVLALAGAAYKGLSAYFQRQKADELLSALGEAPEEQIPNEVLENKTRATIGATVGMPSEQYGLAMQNIRRQQANALKGASDRRNALALVPAIQQTTNDATLKLDSANAQQRISNQRYLDTINSGIASWKSKLFNENERKKYNQKYNYAMSLKGASHQNANSAVDSGIAALGSTKLNDNTTGASVGVNKKEPTYSYTSTGQAVPDKEEGGVAYINPLSNPNRYSLSNETPQRTIGTGNQEIVTSNKGDGYGDAWGNYLKRRMMFKF